MAPPESSPAPAPVAFEDEAEAEAEAEAEEPQRPTAPDSEPPPSATPPAAPPGVIDIADLGPEHGPRYDGMTVTLRGRVEAKVAACTSSVPPSCWGSLALRDVERRKAYPVDLVGSYDGREIHCSFPNDPPPKTKGSTKTTGVVSGSPNARCTPDLDPTVIYELVGVLRYTGGGFTLEPTMIRPER